jgi:hypothetical protein
MAAARIASLDSPTWTEPATQKDLQTRWYGAQKVRPKAQMWLVATLFAVATGVGEAWHLIPGNGHYVELPGRHLSLGIWLPRSPDRVNPDAPSLETRQTDSARAAGGCRICDFRAQGNPFTIPSPPVQPLALVDGVLALDCGFSVPAAFQPFQARAPPLS